MSETVERNRAFHVAVWLDTTGNYGRGLLRGIADYMEAHGRWSLFVEPRATGRFDPAWVRRWQGDGMLVFLEEPRTAVQLRKLKLAIVEIYGHVRDLKLPSVGNDDVAIGRLAAEHLLERRLEHFAYSGYPDQPWSALRRQGFGDAVREAGYTCESHGHPRLFPTPKAWERAQRELLGWLKRLPKPVGLMACSDRHAQNVLDACRRANLEVPDEVAVIGSDNDELLCRVSDPPLSSVADNPRKIGFEAADLLEQLMSGKADPAAVQPRLIPPKGVVTRRSTDMMVIDDELVAGALRFIREHASQAIDVNTVLQRTPLSRSAFYRRFRKAVGRSPHEEILRVRFERVKELLTQTSLPLMRIAHLAGFEHAEYMVAVFKRRTGTTPGRYRASHARHA